MPCHIAGSLEMKQRTVFTLEMLPLLAALSLGVGRDPRRVWPAHSPPRECAAEDQVCTAISRMLNARSDNFLALRGEPYGDKWQGNVSAMGMTCYVEQDAARGADYNCMELAMSPERVSTMFVGLTAAAKRAIPSSWSTWTGSTAEGSRWLRAGPDNSRYALEVALGTGNYTSGAVAVYYASITIYGRDQNAN